jgi:hypothetical protein
VPSAIIDTFTVEVLQPVEQSWQYLYERHRYGIKYEVICAIGNPKIIWLSGPWRGTASDPTIANQSGIKRLLHENEALLSDKIYRGDKISFITAVPGHTYNLDDEEKAYNHLVYSARNSVERLIHRITSSGIFQHVWKYSFRLHQRCMRSVARLVNFTLIYEPLG